MADAGLTTVSNSHAKEQSLSSAVVEAPHAENLVRLPSLEVDENPDEDSAYEGSIASDSTSLRSSIFNYQYENGRRYHAYRAGEYFLPNDETEQDRLDMHHHVYRLMLDGNLHCTPISDTPQRVLDVGTGTGIWAIQFADEYPSAVVTGIDLSPIQPAFVPPNARFYVDDMEQPWGYQDDEKFDFIHWRSMCGTTGNWPRMYQQAYENLKSGGWLEVQDYDGHIRSLDDPKSDKVPWLRDMFEQVRETSSKLGKPVDIARFHKKWMEEAGFVDVQERVISVPVGDWARDPKLKEVGRFERAQLIEAVESHSLALLTRGANYSEEQARVMIEMVRKEFKDRSLRLYSVYRFVYGRKPELHD